MENPVLRQRVYGQENPEESIKEYKRKLAELSKNKKI